MKKTISTLLLTILLTSTIWSQIPATVTTTLKLKAGTVTTINYPVNVVNATIEKEGIGENPKVIFTNISSGFNLQGNSQLINVNVEGDPQINYLTQLNDNSSIIGCDLKGGDPAILLGTGNILTIKGCHVWNTYYDAINGLNNVEVLNIIDTKVDNLYFNENNICELGFNGGGSQDAIHIENAKTINLENVISDHSQTRGKFAFIANKFTKINAVNCIFTSFDVGVATFIGGGVGCLASFTNCQFLGGSVGIQNNSDIELKNCYFKNQKEYAVFQGGVKTFNDCTFENSGIAAIRSWAYTTTLNRCLFLNCKTKYAANGIVENGVSTDINSGIGAKGLVIAEIKPTPKLVDYKSLYLTVKDANIELTKYREAWILARKKATTKGYTFANFVKWMDSLGLK